MLPGVTKLYFMESRRICFKLRSTWKLTSEIQFTKLFLPHRKINKSFLYFEGVFISRAIALVCGFFQTAGKRRESLPHVLNWRESCEIKEACVRD